MTEARLPYSLAHSRPRPIGRDVDHVFLGRDGRPLTPVAIQHALCRLGGRAGLDGVRTNPHRVPPHVAKLYLLNGGDMFSVQRILVLATSPSHGQGHKKMGLLDAALLLCCKA